MSRKDLANGERAHMLVEAPSARQCLSELPPARLSMEGSMTYNLLQPDGTRRESAEPGTLGGNSTLKIYGRLDCARAIAALPLGYARHRVFFADEAAAIRAGYRPCARCMPEQYAIWKAGPLTPESYPWRVAPHHPMATPPSQT